MFIFFPMFMLSKGFRLGYIPRIRENLGFTKKALFSKRVNEYANNSPGPLDAELEAFRRLTPHDIEKELFKLKRQFTFHLSKGNYTEANKLAANMQEKISATMGIH
jgi:hypothetical protein